MRRKLVVMTTAAVMMLASLPPAQADFYEWGTRTCTGSYNPQTRIQANGSAHWHEHDEDLVYKLNPATPNFVGVTYRESLWDQSISYALGFSENAAAPYFSNTYSYSRCIH